MQASLASLVLRLVLATVFIVHGLPKVAAEKGYGTTWMGNALPAPLQAAVSWGEVIGGAALAIGFLPRLAAAGLTIIMIGAIVTVHGAKGFSMQGGGWEYNFVLIGICLAVMLLGGGQWSIGRCLGGKISKL